MTEQMLSIDELLAVAAEQGHAISYRTLRYYSSLNLIASAVKQKDANKRLRGFYPASTVHRIAIIDLLQSRGLNLQQIGAALEHMVDGRTATEAAEQLHNWAERLAVGGNLPLLYDLLPLMQDNLRGAMVDMLRDAGLPAISDSLRNVRLTLTDQQGNSLERLLFIADELLEINQLNFWDLPGLAELMTRLSAKQPLPQSLREVRAWLHGRTDWNPQDFWLARYERQPVGCLGLHRPWPTQLTGTARLFGPLLQPEFIGLSIEQRLLQRAIDRAEEQGLAGLICFISPSADGAGFLPKQGFQPTGSFYRSRIAISDAESVLPTQAIALPAAAGANLLAALFTETPGELLQRAANDPTTPGWVALGDNGEALAAAWLSRLDRQVWIHWSQPIDEAAAKKALSQLLQVITAEAARTGITRLEVWSAFSFDWPGALEQEALTTFCLPLNKPNH